MYGQTERQLPPVVGPGRPATEPADGSCTLPCPTLQSLAERHLHQHWILKAVLYHQTRVAVENRLYKRSFAGAALLDECVGIGDHTAVEDAADVPGHDLESKGTAGAVEVPLGKPCFMGELHQVGHRSLPFAAAVVDCEKGMESGYDALFQLAARLAEVGG